MSNPLKSGQALRGTIALASAITGLSYRTLQDLAARGVIPGASKPAGRWLFVIADLQEWAAGGTGGGDRKCISEMGYGGRVSKSGESNTDLAYERALKPSQRKEKKSPARKSGIKRTSE